MTPVFSVKAISFGLIFDVIKPKICFEGIAIVFKRKLDGIKNSKTKDGKTSFDKAKNANRLRVYKGYLDGLFG
jgi:hypothetical protein